MPLPGLHNRWWVERHGDRFLRGGWAYITDFDAGLESVAVDPYHAGWHVVFFAGQVGKIGDELCEVVALGGRELPLFREAEHEAVEAHVTFLIGVVLVHFGVVAARVGGVVGLGHLDS